MKESLGQHLAQSLGWQTDGFLSSLWLPLRGGRQHECLVSPGCLFLSCSYSMSVSSCRAGAAKEASKIQEVSVIAPGRRAGKCVSLSFKRKVFDLISFPISPGDNPQNMNPVIREGRYSVLDWLGVS